MLAPAAAHVEIETTRKTRKAVLRRECPPIFDALSGDLSLVDLSCALADRG